MSLPRLFLLCATITTLPAPLAAAEKVVANFESEQAMAGWTTVNDSVMGGVSKGDWKRTAENTLLFSGELSLENNGGFSSIRTKKAELELEGMTAISVKARGDGRTYWVELRVAGQMGATSYRTDLPTKAGEWQAITIPISDFKLQAFGRELPAQPISARDIASIGFTLADKKAGPFSLEIARVTATDGTATAAKSPESRDGTIVDIATTAGNFKTLLAAAAAADLVETLSGDGPFTVFAPTDEAFATLPGGTVESLLKPENKSQLADVLRNHVLAGRMSLAKSLEAGEATSLQGSKLTIQFSNAKVMIGTATLLKADLAASNGVIHVIDQVLLPQPAQTAPLGSAGLIELAIKRGVPLFNSGEAGACAALYELTCESVRAHSDLPQELRNGLENALKSAAIEPSGRKKAWILREAMDATWQKLNDAAK